MLTLHLGVRVAVERVEIAPGEWLLLRGPWIPAMM
jgi:hypothetical protein